MYASIAPGRWAARGFVNDFPNRSLIREPASDKAPFPVFFESYLVAGLGVG
jgi:hypothetical protein